MASGVTALWRGGGGEGARAKRLERKPRGWGKTHLSWRHDCSPLLYIHTSLDVSIYDILKYYFYGMY
jgi:hypothetical protein